MSVILYWSVNKNYKTVVIFFLSLIFYGFWRFEFIILIIFSTLVDYFIAIKIYSNFKYKKKLLILSIFFNLSILFIFKYLNFFTDNIFNLAIFFGFKLDPFLTNIILPLGISFYTFQTISYTVDVYRGEIKPEKNFFTYASYVAFFPQLIAGPILRAKEIIPQFKNNLSFKLDNIYIGCRRIIIGLFLKVVLADNISIFVDEGFLISPDNLSAIDVWTLAFLFGFQIYFDFSAYSHIAIGSAKLFGIDFPENFDFPYFASSPKEFWKRWHISLSSWIRDYLYLPLLKINNQNSSREGFGDLLLKKNISKSLFITWILMGLWHGANWTFVIWGIYHAIIIFFFRLVNSMQLKINTSFGWIVTLPIMMLGWIPFRSQSIENSFEMYGKVFNLFNYTHMNMRENSYIICFLLLIGHILTYIFYNFKFLNLQSNLIKYKSFEFIFLTMVILLTIIHFKPTNQFIYFQF
tara:strand:- start:238 stop:1629 length:1392 start_codon:yes stop_codon:yes gene_type:complete